MPFFSKKTKYNSIDTKYKFNEDKILTKLQVYIDNTYDQHYSTDKIQATEFIIDSGHGEGFCIGKYYKVCKTLWKESR